MRFPATDIEHAMQDEIDQLKAENKKLREALEPFAFKVDYPLEDPPVEGYPNPVVSCPQCERYKEAAFRDAIEFSKFRTMLQVASDRIQAARTEALEDAARTVDEGEHIPHGLDAKTILAISQSLTQAAAAIRALKEKE